MVEESKLYDIAKLNEKLSIIGSEDADTLRNEI